MVKHQVIGLGEVGGAIYELFKDEALGYARKKGRIDSCKFLHICFPYSEDFETQVKEYVEKCSPQITIIHSTVPLGTTSKLEAVHSPIRGVHPNLLKGIKTFVKYFGGEKSEEASKPFQEKGILCDCFPDSETTEAIKLWDTTQYGLMILLQKEIKKWCDDKGLDYRAVYRAANASYNTGYMVLGRSEVIRPFLKHMPGPIGGHCIIPNAKMINHWLGDLLLEKNEEWKDDKS